MEYDKLCDQTDPKLHVNVQTWDKTWEITFPGPKDTPYEEGYFTLIFRLNDNYPFKAPFVKFKTKLIHPMLFAHGGTHLAMLYQDWSPVSWMIDVVNTIRELLTNFDDVEYYNNSEVYKMLKEDREGFMKKAAEMTKLHASMPPSPS